MTPEGRAGVVRDNALLDVRSCRELVPMVSRMFGEAELRELRHLRLEVVKVTGDRAVGRVAGVRALERTGDAGLRRTRALARRRRPPGRGWVAWRRRGGRWRPAPRSGKPAYAARA